MCDDFSQGDSTLRMAALSAVNHLHRPTKPAYPVWHEARARHPHGSRIQGRERAKETFSTLWSSTRAGLSTRRTHCNEISECSNHYPDNGQCKRCELERGPCPHANKAGNAGIGSGAGYGIDPVNAHSAAPWPMTSPICGNRPLSDFLNPAFPAGEMVGHQPARGGQTAKQCAQAVELKYIHDIPACHPI